MSYVNQAANYRELEVMSASPERLLVMLFDHLVVQLERARLGIERKDLTLQVTGVSKANSIIGELLATLDFEQGGEIATNLADLYQFMLVELLNIGKSGDAVMLARVANLAQTLRDGFADAAAQLQQVKLSA